MLEIETVTRFLSKIEPNNNFYYACLIVYVVLHLRPVGENPHAMHIHLGYGVVSGFVNYGLCFFHKTKQ
jgi:hypothetical protein